MKNWRKYLKRLCVAGALTALCVTQRSAVSYATQMVDGDTGAQVEQVTPTVLSNAENTGNQGYLIHMGEEEKGQTVVPIECQDLGYLSCVVTNLTEVTTGTGIEGQGVSVGMYADADCTALVGDLQSGSMDAAQNIVYSQEQEVEAGVTYYLKISVLPEVYKDSGVYSFHLQLNEITGKNRDLKIGSSTVSYQQSDDKVYYRMVCKKKGTLDILLDFQQENHGNTQVYLCNKKKKAISAVSKCEKDNKKELVYSVEKGVYYFVVKKEVGQYGISCDYLMQSKQSSHNQQKAKALPLGKKGVSGDISLQSSNEDYDWYKFTLKKNTKVKLQLTAWTTESETVKVEIIPPSRDRKGNHIRFEKDPEITLTGIHVQKSAVSSVWPSGVWYVKINKAANKGSIAYNLKIKTIS